MADTVHTVAVLVANPALSSILSMTLAGASLLRVRPFDSKLALTTYLHLAPADLVVADFDNLAAPADLVAAEIRRDAAIHSRAVQIIALASALSKDAKVASIHAGIDEIIMKPMSPRYLLERVLARLAQPARVPSRSPETPKARLSRRRDWAGFGDNVVPLVRPAAQPRIQS